MHWRCVWHDRTSPALRVTWRFAGAKEITPYARWKPCWDVTRQGTLTYRRCYHASYEPFQRGFLRNYWSGDRI